MRRGLLAAGAVAVVVLGGALGVGLFFPLPLALSFAPFAAVSCALTTRRTLDAAATAALGVVLAPFGAALLSATRFPTIAQWLPGALTAAVAAAAVAAALGALLERRPAWSAWVAALGVVAIVATLALVTYVEVQLPGPDGVLVHTLASPPAIGPSSPDFTIYLAYLRELRAGQPYYSSVLAALKSANAVRGGAIDISTPLSFRLPTLYLALAYLPGAAGLIAAAFACATIAVVAAFALARRFAPAAIALLAALLVASYVSGFLATPSFLDTEFWAGCLALAAAACFVFVAEKPGRRPGLMWASAAFALAAALTRELAFAFLLAGVGATLAGGGERRLRLAAPWLAATALAAVAYAAHWIAASRAISAAHISKPLAVSHGWLQPFGRPLAAVVAWTASSLSLVVWVVVALLVAGLAGSVLVPRLTRDRVFLGLIVCGGAAVQLFLGQGGPATGTGLGPATWGALVMPTTLACAMMLLAPAAEAVSRPAGTLPPEQG